MASLLLAIVGATARPDDAKHVRAFEQFLADHGKVYSGREEWHQRFAIFEANMVFIETENAKGHSYTLGINAFADQTPEEFGSGHLGLRAPASRRPWQGLPHLGTHRYSGADLPTAVDWVAKGAVTDPKNQQQCGSCWSFATTGALEGAWQIATSKLVSLSEQQLVDCSKGDNQGCKGGSMDAAFAFLQNVSTCTEDSYPYTAKDGTCAQDSCTVGIPKGGVTGFKDVEAKSLEALMEAVAQGPVAVAIEADQQAFTLYQGGVLTQTCGNKLDHGVLVVGYGTDDGVDYWKVKNSWGASWGEEGYLRITRAIPGDGECGIQDQPTYPVVQASSAPPAAKAASAPLTVVI